jgi:hypothetical protein
MRIVMRIVPVLLLALAAGRAQFVTEAVKTFPSDPETSVWFGNSIARDDALLVVGAPYTDGPGAAYVFSWQGAGWVEEAKLAAYDGTPGDMFGNAVAVDGTTVLVAAPGFGQPPLAPGLVFVYEHDAAGWSEQAQLRPIDAEHLEEFGYSIDLSGDTAVVGVPYTGSPAGSGNGRVDVFRRVGIDWYLEAQLVPASSASGDHYGRAVALDGDTLLVWNAVVPGSVHVFRRTGTTWALESVLAPEPGSPTNSFGFSLDLDGDVALVSDAGYPLPLAFSGAVHVFRRTGQTWVHEALLTASNAGPAMLGFSVSLDGERALAGCVTGTDGVQQGGAYLFEHVADTWHQSLVLSPTGAQGAGVSVQLQGSSALIAALYDATFVGSGGSVLDFALDPQPWSIVGTGLAGAAGVPGLFGAGSPEAGADVSLIVNNGPPATPVTLVIGTSLLAAPLLGATLYPHPDLLVGGLVTSAEGAASLAAPWPAGVPAGAMFQFQAWLPDSSLPLGWTASAGVQLLVP